MERFHLSDLPEKARIHFIGIGGISMSGLAMIMLKNGYRVTGSDRTKSHITDKLQTLGAEIFIGHNSENVLGADLVVHTAAVHMNNPEMAKAAELGLRLIDRAEFLGAIMREYKTAVGVAGTHGKTTTTSMLAHALIYADLDPTISVGGELDLIGGNIRTGSSEYFVTEACEYTNSFLKFFPTIALITNIEEDHLDFFSGIDDIIKSFRKFALLTKEDGCVIANGDDENIAKALDSTGCRIINYGMSRKNLYHPENLQYIGGYPSFEVYRDSQRLCSLSLNVPGEHNVLNALATVAVCCQIGVDPAAAAKGIETFHGTHRRFEKKGMINEATVIDDYAHHPTEIKTTLKTAQSMPHNKIWCIFQPHTYTRTKTLWKEFTEAFDDADELILTDIYAAREVYDGITRSEDLAEQIAKREKNHVRYIKDFSTIAQLIRREAQPGDMVFRSEEPHV